MSATRKHLATGTLMSLVHRELPPFARLRARYHIVSCGRCRERLQDARTREQAVLALIRDASPAVSEADGWARLKAKTGGQTRDRKQRLIAWPARVAVLAMLSVLLYAARRGVTTEASESDASDAVALLQVALEHPAQRVVRDACCGDHDGGNLADDGLVTLSRPGEHVAAVIVYEDVDQSGTFTRGDIVRYVSKSPRP